MLFSYSYHSKESRENNYHLSRHMYALGLCNAPTTFQRCMTIIFYDLIEDIMEVSMDDFPIFGDSFDL